MESAEERLAIIGYGRRRGEPACWRAVRVDPPARRIDNPQDPSHSRALALWREVLARNSRPSPYRISRIA